MSGTRSKVLTPASRARHSRALDESARRTTRPGPRAAARLAASYMGAHADEPMSMARIAAACGLSVRTLHRSFVREFRTTPLQYLKRRRLEHVRTDLLVAAPGTTVTSAALHRGITHLGRFAHDYCAAFGESPSSTLRRSCPAAAAASAQPDTREGAALPVASLSV